MPEVATWQGQGRGGQGASRWPWEHRPEWARGGILAEPGLLNGAMPGAWPQGHPRGEDGYFEDRREAGRSWGPWNEGAMMWPWRLKGEGRRDSRTNCSTAPPLFLGPPTSDAPWTLPTVCRGP